MGCLHALGRSAQRAQPQERVQRRVDAPLAGADRPIQERSADRVPGRPVHRSVGAVLIDEEPHMHMHVTGFSAATIFVFAIASPLRAQGIEVFGGYSVNADYVQNRPAILVVEQKVSPFFSHGSGPAGFEASFKQDVRNGLGIKVDVSGYSDTFPPGPAAYCQPASSTTGIACGTGLTFQATGRAFYVTAGPEWKIRRGKRFAPFAQVLVGIVYTRSTFMMSGSDVQYKNPLTGGVLLCTS